MYQFGALVSDVADPWVNSVKLQLHRGYSFKNGVVFVKIVVEPDVSLFRFQHKGHTIVQVGDIPSGRAGDNGTGQEFGFAVGPVVPETSKDKRLRGCSLDEIGDLVASLFLPPLLNIIFRHI